MVSGVRQFSGETLQTRVFDGIVATETEYSFSFIDWHYHAHPYFSLVTAGNCREINRRGTIDFTLDSLVFHNHQEPHCSAKAGGTSRHFQLEISQEWCRKFDLDPDRMPASSKLLNPRLKLFFHQIYQESKAGDANSPLTVDSLLLQSFETMQGIEKTAASPKPKWVNKIDELLHDNFDQPLSLIELSAELNLHAAHLSRDFPRYFRCNFSEYLRMIKVEKAVSMLRNRQISLTDIAQNCGFADQSHFIRCFKQFVGVTPKAYRKLVW